MNNDTLALAAGKLAADRHEAERILVYLVAADPELSIDAEDEGLDVRDLWDRGHRIVYHALALTWPQGNLFGLQLAAKALKIEGLWSDDEPAGSRGALWSWERLARAATSNTGAPLVKRAVRELLALSRRQCAVDDAAATLNALLRSYVAAVEAGPAPIATTFRSTIVRPGGAA